MRRYTVEIAGQERSVEIERRADGSVHSRVAGSDRSFAATGDGGLLLDDRGRAFRVDAVRKNGRWTVQVGQAAAGALVSDGARRPARSRGGASASGAGGVHAPMPGRVLRVAVRTGDRVAAGQALVVIEAMKMENEIRAGAAGTVRDVAVREGQPVETGERLLTLEP